MFTLQKLLERQFKKPWRETKTAFAWMEKLPSISKLKHGSSDYCRLWKELKFQRNYLNIHLRINCTWLASGTCAKVQLHLNNLQESYCRGITFRCIKLEGTCETIMWNCWKNLQIDKRKLKWEYMRMNIKKLTKPKIYMISPQTVVIYAPLKSRKKWKRSSKTLLPWSRDIIRDFHFHTEWQLFYLPIELTQINLKVQTHANAFSTRILGSC